MPLPNISNYTAAKKYNPQETVSQLEEVFKDKKTFQAMSLDDKIDLFMAYMYYNNAVQYSGGAHDMNRFWYVKNNKIFQSVAVTIAENVPDGEDCLEELKHPGVQRIVFQKDDWTDEMYEKGFRVNDYEQKLKNGQLNRIREERALKEQERRERLAREEQRRKEREEREARERQEAAEREAQRLKDEAAEKERQEREAKEREERERQEAAEREAQRIKDLAAMKERLEREAAEREAQRLKDEAAEKERQEREAKERERLEKARQEREARRKQEELRQQKLREEQAKEEERKRREREAAEKAVKEAEKKALEEDKAQAKKDIAELEEKIKKDRLSFDSYEQRVDVRKYLTAKVIEQEGYKPSMKATIKGEVNRNRLLMEAMNDILQSPVSGEEKLFLLNSDYVRKLAQNGTLTDLTTRKGRADAGFDAAKEQYERDFRNVNRIGISNMETKAGQAVRDGNAAKRNVYFGSAEYDQAVEAMENVRLISDELKAGSGRLTPEERDRLQEKLVDAEQKIDSYFARKVRRRELTEDGSFTARTDEKSKRRINVLKEARASINLLRSDLQLESPRPALKEGVKDTSFNQMVDQLKPEVNAVKEVKGKHTSKIPGKEHTNQNTFG